MGGLLSMLAVYASFHLLAVIAIGLVHAVPFMVAAYFLSRAMAWFSYGLGS